MNYARLQLKYFVGSDLEKFNEWVESQNDKGELHIVEKSFHTSSTQRTHRCAMEIWYHISDIPNHDKCVIYNEHGGRVVMDLPTKSGRFKVGNMEGCSLLCFGNKTDEDMRLLSFRHNGDVSDDMPTIQIPFEVAKQFLPPAVYAKHTDYVSQDNEV